MKCWGGGSLLDTSLSVTIPSQRIKLFDKRHVFPFNSPSLTWRDVQHVIVRSARSAPGGVPLANGFWVKNKAGLAVSKFYGFGLMDAGKMVQLAKYWRTVPQQRTCEIKGTDNNRCDIFGLIIKTCLGDYNLDITVFF